MGAPVGGPPTGGGGSSAGRTVAIVVLSVCAAMAALVVVVAGIAFVASDRDDDVATEAAPALPPVAPTWTPWVHPAIGFTASFPAGMVVQQDDIPASAEDDATYGGLVLSSEREVGVSVTPFDEPVSSWGVTPGELFDVVQNDLVELGFVVNWSADSNHDGAPARDLILVPPVETAKSSGLGRLVLIDDRWLVLFFTANNDEADARADFEQLTESFTLPAP